MNSNFIFELVIDRLISDGRGSVSGFWGVRRLTRGDIGYVSCNPATLARDLRHLIAAGYLIIKDFLEISQLFWQIADHTYTMSVRLDSHQNWEAVLASGQFAASLNGETGEAELIAIEGGEGGRVLPYEEALALLNRYVVVEWNGMEWNGMEGIGTGYSGRGWMV